MRNREKIVIGAVGLVGAGLIASLWFALGYNQSKYSSDCSGSQVSGGKGSIGGPFTLVDENEKTVTDLDVFTEPSLVYFGYSFCPDVCPLDNSRNAEAVELLEERGYQVQPVFISVDPDRDTPEVLKEFTDYFHPRMLGLSGSHEQVKAASQAYRTYYRLHDQEDEFYLVDHSTFTYLVFPESGFVEYFTRETSAEEMADVTACYIDEIQ